MTSFDREEHSGMDKLPAVARPARLLLLAGVFLLLLSLAFILRGAFPGFGG